MSELCEAALEAQQVVLCDMCTEDRKPALKTCMKCEMSMCVRHLQAHLDTPFLLQTHPLTEPLAPADTGLGGATKCPHHGKLLEYYCLDDRTTVCVSCAIEDHHRLHNMKTLSTAHKELLEKLKPEQQALVQIEEQGLKLESWEKSERKKLECSSVRLINAVTALRDIALTSVQSSVSARVAAIHTSKSSMQAAQKEEDTFRFLQTYAGVHEAVEKARSVDLRLGLEPGEDRDRLVREIRQNGDKMVVQGVELWSSLLTLVDPENHREIFSFKHDLTFDPNSLREGMFLSKDNRKVFYNNKFGKCFSHTLLIKLPNSDEEMTHDNTFGNHMAIVPSRGPFFAAASVAFGDVMTKSDDQATVPEADLGTNNLRWVVLRKGSILAHPIFWSS
ncbi:tripartite motif-containing protein 16 [Aplochiton taeniatus]